MEETQPTASPCIPSYRPDSPPPCWCRAVCQQEGAGGDAAAPSTEAGEGAPAVSSDAAAGDAPAAAAAEEGVSAATTAAEEGQKEEL